MAMFFARRYLFSKRSRSVINIISWVSVVAVGVPVAAMIVLLSVFNGLEGLVRGMYNAFDPDVVVSATEGKTFDVATVDTAALWRTGLVAGMSFVLEDEALLEYRGRQYIAKVRGVDSSYRAVVPIEGMVTAGGYSLRFGDLEQALLGRGLSYYLGVSLSLYDRIAVYAPRNNTFSSLLPMESFRREQVFPTGEFTLAEETDSKYMITRIEFTRKLFSAEGMASALFISLDDPAAADKARTELSRRLGDGFKVLTRAELRPSLYRIMKYEKWGVFFIALLVMVIAAFSIVGSLAMLIIDKRDDIATISTLGGRTRFIRGMFSVEGMMISSLGAVGGLVVGLLFCFGQQTFGWISIPAETFLVDSYPVVVELRDVLLVVASFTAVNYLIVRLTVTRMIRNKDMMS